MEAGDDSHDGYLERIEITDPRTLDLSEYEHQARYRWAASLVTGGEILDVACGTGHGSEVLAACGSVTGIDIASEAVERARSRTQRGGVFIQAEVPPIPLDDDCFDAVVSFETIEHLDRDADFVAEIYRVLKPGGQLLISSPNSAATSPDGIVSNQFHVREYRLAEFTTLLKGAGFTVDEVLGQSSAAKGRGHQLIRSISWRLRFLGRVSDRLRRSLYGGILDRDVRPMSEKDLPDFWVLRCRS